MVQFNLVQIKFIDADINLFIKPISLNQFQTQISNSRYDPPKKMIYDSRRIYLRKLLPSLK